MKITMSREETIKFIKGAIPSRLMEGMEITDINFRYGGELEIQLSPIPEPKPEQPEEKGEA